MTLHVTRRRLAALAGIASLVTLSAVAGSQAAAVGWQQPQQQPAAPAGADKQWPPPDGQALWQYLQARNFQQWPLWPGTERYYASESPVHGALLTTYVNQVALDAIRKAPRQPLPAHAIVVKENYSKAKELMSHTVMYKVQGYAPAAGDWFWLKVLPDGTIEAAGQVQTCQTCHSRAKVGYTFAHGNE